MRFIHWKYLVPLLNFNFVSWKIYFDSHNQRKRKREFIFFRRNLLIDSRLFLYRENLQVLISIFLWRKIYTDQEQTFSQRISVVLLSQVCTLLTSIYQMNRSESSHFQCIFFSFNVVRLRTCRDTFLCEFQSFFPIIF